MFNGHSPKHSVQSLHSWPYFSSVFPNYYANPSQSSLLGESDAGDDAKDFLSFFDFYDMDSIQIKEDVDPIKRVMNKEAYCFDMVKFAEKFVDAILIEVKQRILQLLKPLSNGEASVTFMDKRSDQAVEQYSNPKYSLASFTRSSLMSCADSSVNWPKISEFNIKLGQEKLESYVSKWERSDDWMFCIEFLGFECEDCSNIFLYEVEWSKPTMSYPIPQATASVFFAMDVFKMVPHTHDRIVEVSYIFECSNVIHIPGKIDFQEKWLEDIIDAKLRLFKSITFSVSDVRFSLSSGKSLDEVSFLYVPGNAPETMR